MKPQLSRMNHLKKPAHHCLTSHVFALTCSELRMKGAWKLEATEKCGHKRLRSTSGEVTSFSFGAQGMAPMVFP